MPSCRKIFLLLALACQFAFAVVPPSGLLLCVGADGHFDVEAPTKVGPVMRFPEQAHRLAIVAMSSSPLSKRLSARILGLMSSYHL